MNIASTNSCIHGFLLHKYARVKLLAQMVREPFKCQKLPGCFHSGCCVPTGSVSSGGFTAWGRLVVSGDCFPWLSLAFPAGLRTWGCVPCAYFPAVHLLWSTVCSDLLPIFWLGGFLNDFVRVRYIFWMQVPNKSCSANIFPLSVACLFILFTVTCRAEVLDFDEAQFIIFFFYWLCFWWCI